VTSLRFRAFICPTGLMRGMVGERMAGRTRGRTDGQLIGWNREVSTAAAAALCHGRLSSDAA
jgi:hypothetical protein